MGENVETVGYRYSTPHGLVVTKTMTKSRSEPLMTVAQHERIVAGLEADAARWRQQREVIDGHYIDMTPELWDQRADAFLAQTAEGVLGALEEAA